MSTERSVRPRRDRIGPSRETRQPQPRFAGLLALAVLVVAGAWPAAARQFEIGELAVSLDTTLSVGASMRLASRDCKLIWVGHGGCSRDPVTINSDDGNLNYSQGDFFSTAAKATFDLELSLERFGGFFRATAFYDAVANEKDPQRTDLDRDARYRSSVINSGVVGTGFLLLDAYLYGNFDVFDRFLEVRAGNQVVSWGENLFIPGGINQINAADVTRLRTPGSRIREALLPAPMIWASFEPLENVGIEAYYQLYWNRTQLDPTGTYFSFNDLVGRAAEGLFLPAATDLFGPADPGGTGLTANELFALGRGIPRKRDDKPPNSRQAGVALRYYSPAIRTEFGLYYLHYHGKTPGLAFVTGPSLATLFLTGYVREYPEDINLYGFSVSTEILNVAFGAEVSYRPDDPVPIQSNGIAFLKATADPFTPQKANGFETEKRLQAQINAIWSVGPGTRLLGPLVTLIRADDIAVIGEAALVKYDLDHQDDFRRVNEQLPPLLVDTIGARYAAAPGRKVDDFSWGYQVQVQPTYTNPFGIPITVTPRVNYQHDVHGDTPGQLPFIEDRMAVTVGVNVDYLNTWVWDLAYTDFFGAGAANQLRDRDFLSMSLSYSF
ncbi:MAG: DUF1302 domain-containing protein [Myxococcota bacterium]|nr:DUF1302 domain-containing protein [Myxococcota bacterium]